MFLLTKQTPSESWLLGRRNSPDPRLVKAPSRRAKASTCLLLVGVLKLRLLYRGWPLLHDCSSCSNPSLPLGAPVSNKSHPPPLLLLLLRLLMLHDSPYVPAGIHCPPTPNPPQPTANLPLARLLARGFGQVLLRRPRQLTIMLMDPGEKNERQRAAPTGS